jgi:ABC-type antimicrobial peptide transport system permease subunit
MDVWLQRLAQLINILRPKAYNVIARSVIGLGALLVAESQLNIFQVLAVALYEKFFGPSRVLVQLTEGNATLWVGLVLVFVGLIYHILMTVGQNLIDLKLSEIPKRPELCLEVLNSDLEPYKNLSINLRGNIVEALKENEIPKYESPPITPYQSVMSNMMNAYRDVGRNRNFYKERNDLLKI